MAYYAVYESTPGYMPETPARHFDNYDEAVAYVVELGRGLEEAGYPPATCDLSGATFQRWETHRDERDLGRVIVLAQIGAGDYDPEPETEV